MGQHVPNGPQGYSALFSGGDRGTHTDTVINVRHTVMAVAWLALNQVVRHFPSTWHRFHRYIFQLDPMEAQSRTRPQRFWHGSDIAKLTLVPTKAEQLHVGDKVSLVHPEGQPFTLHGQGQAATVHKVQVYMVKETRSRVNVLWQDGTRETLNATDIIPQLSPDESDCWCVSSFRLV